MKRVLVVMGLVASAVLQAQDVNEIVKKHIDAVGGEENWNKVKSIRMECSMKVQGSDIRILICGVDRKSTRQDIEAMGKKGYSIITETEGWNFMPFWGHTKPEAMTADQVKNAQDDLNLRDEFITYKELGKSIEYLGKDDIEGIECHKIKMVDKLGQETTYFMDTETLYVIKQVDKVKADGKETENVTMYSNFEKLPEGIVFPMAISSGWGVTDIVKLEINPALDESLFKLPAQ